MTYKYRAALTGTVTTVLLGGAAVWAQNAAQTTASAVAAPAPMLAVTLPTTPPPGAIVLLGSDGNAFKNNWYKRRSTNAADWGFERGVITPKGTDLTSKQEFGDAFIHVEFATPKNAEVGHGNAGVGIQGRYEIQILNNYGQKPERHAAGALYSQKPARVNASKRAGEWQTYDIIFRAPRFGADGKVTEQPRATVFHNGVLVQNNEAFNGMTGIQYEQYKEQTATGPLVLQGDHEPVQYRNIWVVPM